MIRPVVVAAALAGLAPGALARADEARPPARLRIGLDRLRAAGVERTYADAVETRVCVALVEAARGADVVCPADVEAAAKRAASIPSPGSTTSRRWWGISARSAAVGFAVPTSRPR